MEEACSFCATEMLIKDGVEGLQKVRAFLMGELLIERIIVRGRESVLE